MLRNITIENYRLFEKFQLEGLTQINLLVGTNNSGKSSLLEAIYLLVNHEDPGSLLEVLYTRGEFVVKKDQDDEMAQLAEVFRGHQLQGDRKIIIATQNDEAMSLEYSFLDYGISWPYKGGHEVGVGLVFRQAEQDEILTYFELEDLEDGLFARGYTGGPSRRLDKSKINKYFVTAERLSLERISRLWNQIVLTPKEDMVINILRILEPNLERIALTNQTTLELSVQLKIRGNDGPLPLGSMGDGIYRIFALALLLVNCENGALFVDEIDTGLHHQALTKMWGLVIETAKRLNVQVFATTHSWDCLVSFHKALQQANESNLGSVFRLERKNGQLSYVSYTGAELAVAIEHDIEVR